MSRRRPRKDPYATLGVEREASAERIRSAYRRLARDHHPDRAGEPSTRRFQEIAEAYETLSDPARRADHDREGERAEDGGVRIEVRVWPSDPARRAREVEPLIPRASEPEPLLGDPLRRRRRPRDPWGRR